MPGNDPVVFYLQLFSQLVFLLYASLVFALALYGKRAFAALVANKISVGVTDELRSQLQESQQRVQTTFYGFALGFVLAVAGLGFLLGTGNAYMYWYVLVLVNVPS